jgi:GT2 family glycosyltransferase
MITHNRGEQICTALEHLLELPEKPRVIVVDNASTDGTVDILRTLGNTINLITLNENLGCAGRNVGVRLAETPYIAFSDDDSWWAPGALSHAADLFDAHPTLGLLAARILVGINERLDPLSHLMAHSNLAREHQGKLCPIGVPIVGFAACGAIVRRDAFLDAGGFEQRFGVGGEEQILALDLLRNGWQLAYVEEIIAHHFPSPIRNPAKRKRIEVRNALWSAWLRRPAASALTETWRVVRLALKDEPRRAGLFDAISGLHWILPARNPVPAQIDYQVKIVEREL